MASLGVQLVGYILGLLGLLGTSIAMLLPNWRTSSYVGASIVTAVGFSKGLWMECATHSTGITQCDIYSTLLGLPADIQAAQAMMVTSSAMSSLACIISVVGMRCTVFCQESRAKDRVAVVGGVFFILGGILGFIPVAWNLHGILRDFYSPLVPDSMKFEIGEALYLGIISSLFSLVAGVILCFSCSPQGNRTNYYDGYQAQPLATRSSPRSVQQPKAKTKEMDCSVMGPEASLPVFAMNAVCPDLFASELRELSHGIQQKAAGYKMGGNLGSKERTQTTKAHTRITSQGISYNFYTFVGQGRKHCYRKAQEANAKHRAAAL